MTVTSHMPTPAPLAHPAQTLNESHQALPEGPDRPRGIIPVKTDPQSGKVQYDSDGNPDGAMPGLHGGWIAEGHHYPSDMAQNF